MADDSLKKAPKVKAITTEFTFQTFDSLMIFDAGSDGFKLKDTNDAVITVPTGIPISISGQAGKASGPITIQAPDTGSLNVSAIYYD